MCRHSNYKGYYTMGYTHYFPQQRDFSDDEWSLITKAFVKINNYLPLLSLDEIFSKSYCKRYSKTERVIILPETDLGWTDFFTHSTNLAKTKNSICFNGEGELSHETFLIEKKPKNKEFIFCKTADKPYDIMVTSMLLICAGYAEGALLISSDGDSDDWADAVKFVSRALGKSTKIYFDSEGYLKVKSPDPEDIRNMEQEKEFEDTFKKVKSPKIKKTFLKIVENKD